MGEGSRGGKWRGEAGGGWEGTGVVGREEREGEGRGGRGGGGVLEPGALTAAQQADSRPHVASEQGAPPDSASAQQGNTQNTPEKGNTPRADSEHSRGGSHSESPSQGQAGRTPGPWAIVTVLTATIHFDYTHSSKDWSDKLPARPLLQHPPTPAPRTVSRPVAGGHLARGSPDACSGPGVFLSTEVHGPLQVPAAEGEAFYLKSRL